jgi:hypothetical protein
MTHNPFAWLSGNLSAVTSDEPKYDNKLFQKLALANTPTSEMTSRGRKAGKQSLSQGAPYGPEFERIRALPTRDWRTDYDVQRLVEQYTAEFRFDGGRDRSQRLRPMQAAALHELRTYGRLYVVAGLGLGKTKLSGLAPAVLGATADNTLYLPPAKLVEKTKTELSREYISGWRVVPPKHVYSAESFSLPKQAELLFKLKPRVIVLDESHVWSNPKSGRSKRLKQYLEAAADAEWPCSVITLTATPGDTSLGTQAHLLEWTLGRGNSPLPTDKSELWVWKMCLDADTGYDVKTKKQRSRPQPGALAEFLRPGECATLENVRNAVGARMESTPGVFYWRTDDAGIPCTIRDTKFTEHSSRLVEEFALARAGDDELSDGSVLDVPVLPGVLFATLGLGFARLIDPPPPQEWRDARKAYNSLIREILEDESSGLHTPGQVALRFASGDLQDTSGAVRDWRELRETFEVHRRVLWIDDSALQAVASLAAAEDTIVWCAAPEFGRRLAKLTGMPFFANQGIDAKSGACISDYVPGRDGPKSVIASIASCGTGFNLQAGWHRNLVVGCPGKSDTLCQLIGRTLRPGQSASSVDVQVFMASIENVLSLQRARERAVVDRTLGRATYNILLDAEWRVSPLAEYVDPTSAVWSSQRTRLLDSDDDV